MNSAILQDDFDDLCEALTDSLSSSSPVQGTPINTPTQADSSAAAKAAAKAVPNTAAPCIVSSTQPGIALSTVLPDAVGPGVKAPAAVSGEILPAPASSADLAQLAAQLQALAEEMSRLRLGMDRLLAVSDATYRQGPDPASLGPLRESDHLQAAGATTGVSAANNVEGSEGARGRALWVQERLLLEAQALLGEMMAGSSYPGAAGVFTDMHLRRGPAHAKKARAAAAAASAAASAAAAAAAAAATAAATEAPADGMELAGTQSPHCSNTIAQERQLAQFVEAANSLASFVVASSSCPSVVVQAHAIGRDSLFCNTTGAGQETTPVKIVGGSTMAAVAAWDSGASQLGPENNSQGQSRGRGSVDTGARDDDVGNSRNRGCISSTRDQCPMIVASQQLNLPSSITSSTLYRPGIQSVQLPAVSPIRLASIPAGQQSAFRCPSKNLGTETLGGEYSDVGDGCAGLCPAPRTHSEGQGHFTASSSDQQLRPWPSPAGLPSIIAASQIEALQGPQASWPYLQDQGGPGGRGAGHPPAVSSAGAAVLMGFSGLGAKSVTVATALRYCI